jgi:hypothetical protein
MAKQETFEGKRAINAPAPKVVWARPQLGGRRRQLKSAVAASRQPR